MIQAEFDFPYQRGTGLRQSYASSCRSGASRLFNGASCYQAVKREESTRRMFYKWLNAARAARHRRQTLQEAEDDMSRWRLEVAWDTWRGRFKTEKLLPLVCLSGLSG